MSSEIFRRFSANYRESDLSVEASQSASPSFASEKLATLICHPLAGEKTIFDPQEMAIYLQDLQSSSFDPISEVVKNLFQETAFAATPEHVLEAVKTGKKHIVFQPKPNLLLAWEKTGASYTLTVFSAPETSTPLPPYKGGFFSWFFAFKHALWTSLFGEMLPEWNDSKQKVDPLAACYQNLPVSIFSEKWLQAWQKQESSPLKLLVPLESYLLPPQPLPASQDEAGWLSRFSTSPVGRNPAYWLYKQWMKRHLPLDEYRLFHFQHRLSLLDHVKPGLQEEATGKLLRSLAKKGRELVWKYLPESKQALLDRKTPNEEVHGRTKFPIHLAGRQGFLAFPRVEGTPFLCNVEIKAKKEGSGAPNQIPPILQERMSLLTMEQYKKNDHSQKFHRHADPKDSRLWPGNDKKHMLREILGYAKPGNFQDVWIRERQKVHSFFCPEEYLECQDIRKQLNRLAKEQGTDQTFPREMVIDRKAHYSYGFEQESGWMNYSQMSYYSYPSPGIPDLLEALGRFSYAAPECILIKALDLLRYPLALENASQLSPNSFFRLHLERFFDEAFMTEEIVSLEEKTKTKDLTQEEIKKFQFQAMEAREKSGSLPWVQLMDDPSRRPFVEAFLKQAFSAVQKSQDDVFEVLGALMLFSARLLAYKKELAIPDYEPLIRRMQEDSSLDHNHLLCLRTLLFWIFAEQGNIEKANIYRPRETDGWHAKDQEDPRPWGEADIGRICAWDRKIPVAALDPLDELRPSAFDWSSIAAKVEQELEGIIDASTWTAVSSTEAWCKITLSSGCKRNITVKRKGFEHSVFLDRYRVSPASNDPKCIKNCKQLPLPLNELLIGYFSQYAYFIYQKSTGEQLGFFQEEDKYTPNNAPPETLSGYWWDGERIELTEDFCLKEMPSLRWQKAEDGQIHDHELRDVHTEEVKKHVFHLPPPPMQGERVVSFAIDYTDGRYQPKNLEEQLCLLQVYLESDDLENVKKALRSLPFAAHKLSPMSMRQMHSIFRMIEGKKADSFAHLQLSMQLLETFYRWLENPTLAEKYPSELNALLLQCLQTWRLYQNAHQNGLQSLLLNERDRKNLAERQLVLLQETSPLATMKGISGSILRMLFAWQAPPISEQIAWRKKVHLQAPDFYKIFRTEERGAVYKDRPAVAEEIWHAFSRHILGRKYTFLERTYSLSTYQNELKSFIFSPSFNRETVLQKRLEIISEYCADSERNYTLHLLDYALEKEIPQKENENFGAFLARLEQEKYTKNILQLLGGKIFELLSKGVEILQSLPMIVQSAMASFRSPFSLSERADPFLIDERIPSLLEPYQKPPENREQKQIRLEILAKANKTSRERDEKLKMQTAENVEWSHLEGLFGQNALFRLQSINPLLSSKECLELDEEMHRYYLASGRTDYQYDPKQLTATVRALLMLEHVTGMTIRADQVEKLQKLLSLNPETGNYRNLALQMGMGGGKTSVLASIAMLMAAKPGRIAVFIPLAAQFDSLAYDFCKWQKERFQQEIIPIHLAPHLLHEEKTLQWIKKQMDLAKKEGHGLLIHPETLHHLQLLWRSESNPKILRLALEIRQDFLDNADALLDEVDKMLYPLKDTSLTVGPEKHLSKPYISSFRRLIELHQKDPLIWKALLTNKPQQIDLEKYKIFQRDVLAKRLTQEVFSIPLELQESCSRYLVGEATKERDLNFLDWLSHNPQKDAIDVHNHWLEDVLRHAIFKERGRHYGRKGKLPSIVSYDGVANPSNRKFAQPGEETGYYFLNTLSKGYHEALLQEIVNHYKNVSSLDPLNRSKIDDKVYKLFGLSLKELESPEGFARALQLVNEKTALRLELEEHFIQNYVVYYEHQITSTSQSLLSMFSTHRGFSGTFPQFINDFDHEVEADLEVDPKIEKAMIAHNEPILALDASADTFFADLRQSSGPINGLIDMGARFRDFPNEEVAKKALEQLDNIEYALFFGKAQESDETADTPMLLRYDRETSTFHKHVISSTKRDVLASWGVNDLRKLFVYFDERHCEAIDVEQLMNGRNICTFGIHTTKRDLFQGVMRMRNYQGEKDPSTHQNALFVLDSETKKTLFGAAEIVQPKKLIEKAKEIEAKETALCSPRTYYHAIDAAFFAEAEELLKGALSNPKKLSEVQSFFHYLVVDPSPSRQFGGIYVTEEMHGYFQAHIRKRKEELKNIYPGSRLPGSLEKKLQKINENLLKALHQTKHMPSKISHKQSSLQLGQEQQQRQRQEQKQEQETKISSWSIPPLRGYLWEEQLQPARYDLATYYKSFFGPLLSSYLVSKEFDSRLLQGLQATENWLRTYTHTHALNHPAQKKAFFVLLEKKEEKMVPTILSLYDYQTYLRGRQTLPPQSCICTALPLSESGLAPCLSGPQWSPDLIVGEEKNLKKLWMQLAFINADPFYIMANHQDLGEPLTREHFAFLRERVKHWNRGKDLEKHKQNIESLVRELEENLSKGEIL